MAPIDGQEVFGSRYEAGEIVFEQGESGEVMYLIQSGSIEIRRSDSSGEITLARLFEGEFFGELALLDDRPRTASAAATTATRLLPLSRAALLERVASDPRVALHLIEVMCERIRRTTDRVVAETKESTENVDIELPVVAENVAVGRSPWESLAVVEVDVGTEIIAQGDASDAMFIIVEGDVEVVRQSGTSSQIVARAGRNDIIGETALIGERVRSASVIASSRCRLVRISTGEFLGLARDHPELALHVFQALVSRLHRTLETIDNPMLAYEVVSRTPPHLESPEEGRLKLALVTLAGCAGCTVSILDKPGVLATLARETDIVYCPLLLDGDIPDEVDAVVVEGAVRTREEEALLREMRGKSRILVAWGTCATHGGVPAMANDFELEALIEGSYGSAADTFSYYLSGALGVERGSYQADHLALLRKAGSVHDYVRVDYYIPGCPPEAEHLVQLVSELVRDTAPEKSAALVCKECNRKPSGEPSESFSMTFQRSEDDGLCMTSAGTPCMGFLTRGGCGAICPDAGLPCWGCRGSSRGALGNIKKGETYEQVMLSSFARRCKVAQDEVKPMLLALKRRGNTSLGLEHGFIHDDSRLR